MTTCDLAHWFHQLQRTMQGQTAYNLPHSACTLYMHSAQNACTVSAQYVQSTAAYATVLGVDITHTYAICEQRVYSMHAQCTCSLRISHTVYALYTGCTQYAPSVLMAHNMQQTTNCTQSSPYMQSTCWYVGLRLSVAAGAAFTFHSSTCALLGLYSGPSFGP